MISELIMLNKLNAKLYSPATVWFLKTMAYFRLNSTSVANCTHIILFLRHFQPKQCKGYTSNAFVYALIHPRTPKEDYIRHQLKIFRCLINKYHAFYYKLGEHFIYI